MSVGLLIITHNRIGEDLLNTAESMLGMCPLQTSHLAVSQSGDPDKLFEEATRRCDKLDSGDGVLVLTDMYGSTPSNIATRLLEHARADQFFAAPRHPAAARFIEGELID